MIPTFAEPSQLWLTLSDTLQQTAWQTAQSAATPGGRWQIYLNRLSLQAFLSWLQSKDLVCQRVFPALDEPGTGWELVTGSCLQLGDRTLALIPTDELGHDTFELPQEWVDLPSWAADYYIALKVNPEDGWLECWGYATHQQIKTLGRYDASERTINLTGDQLSRNINVLWTTLDYCPTVQMRAATEPVAELSAQQATQLIERLSNPSVAFPRLSVPFAQWGALLNNAQWRSRLYQQRASSLMGQSESFVIAAGITHLSTWLQSLRENLTDIIESSIGMSGRWMPTQLTLRSQSQPSADAVSRTQAKIIQLGSADVTPQFKLIIFCQLADDDSRLTINVEIHPAADDAHLPADTTLSLLAHDGSTLQSVYSREDDLYIRLKQFKCPLDYEFGVLISLGEFQHIERFKA